MKRAAAKTPPAAKGTQKTFGFKPVKAAERTHMVKEVFASVAPTYDVMNDLMSLGIHRLWKRDFVREVAPEAGEAILDLAGVSGDIEFLLRHARNTANSKIKFEYYLALWAATAAAPAYVGEATRRLSDKKENKITICDINPAMLEVGKKRAMDRGLHGAFNWVEGNAEALPFADNSFDVVTLAFGLRNVTHLARALREIERVLKPGGRFFCLEFSHVAVPLLQKIYDTYSFSLLPWLGEKVAGDRASYQYLAESIRAFPDQDALVELMKEAGFSAVTYRNFSFGIAAVHRGVKW
jgi:ubiquinone/menaquinone biosynthesis methyltransferase